MLIIFRNMPDIDTLMQEWPPEFEDLLKEVGNIIGIDLNIKLLFFVLYFCCLMLPLFY